jgi:hypothetical protein
VGSIETLTGVEEANIVEENLVVGPTSTPRLSSSDDVAAGVRLKNPRNDLRFVTHDSTCCSFYCHLDDVMLVAGAML